MKERITFELEMENLGIRQKPHPNVVWSQKLGWGRYIDQITQALGLNFTPSSVGNPDFVDAVKQWQAQRGDENSDGVIRPKTWRKLKAEINSNSNANWEPSYQLKSMVNWAQVHPNQRMRYVMNLLVTQYGYPVNGAAGIVGNLYAESGLIPNRIEGSRADIPMKSFPMEALPFIKAEQPIPTTIEKVEFTPEEVMKRIENKQGPALAGVGLAQWTLRSRRAGLFKHTFQGQKLGAAILYNMDAQVDYLVTELRTPQYSHVDNILRRANISLEEASDEVARNYENPRSMSDPKTAKPELAKRKGHSQNALRVYTTQQQ